MLHVKAHLEFQPIVTNGAHAAWLAADHRDGVFAFHDLHQTFGGGATRARGLGKHASRDERTTAAAERWQYDAVSERFKQFDRCMTNARLVVHGEAVREQHHRGRTGRCLAAATRVPTVKTLGVQRHGTARVDTEHPVLHGAHKRGAIGEIGKRPQARKQSVDAAYTPKRARTERHAAGGGVALSGVFGLQLGDVNV